MACHCVYHHSRTNPRPRPCIMTSWKWTNLQQRVSISSNATLKSRLASCRCTCHARLQLRQRASNPSSQSCRRTLVHRRPEWGQRAAEPECPQPLSRPSLSSLFHLLHQTTRNQFGHPCSRRRISGRGSVSSPFVTVESMLDRFFSRRGSRGRKILQPDPGPGCSAW